MLHKPQLIDWGFSWTTADARTHLIPNIITQCYVTFIKETRQATILYSTHI